MKINFELDEYLLAWNLLYGASISQKVHSFKEKLWNNYKKQYNKGIKDKDEILKDGKNYIPDDDMLYNMVFDTGIYETIRDEAEEYRQELLRFWDENKKKVIKNMKEILRFPVTDSYNVLILHPKMDTIVSTSKSNNIGWGFRNDLKNPILTLTNLIYTLVSYELKEFNREYKEIVQAIIELAIHNELYTRLSGKSNHLDGDKSLTFLKRQIYPYWLMYLGCDKEEMIQYMMRDGIAFEIDHYTVETQLRKIDLYEFIKFCVKNQKHILRINNLEII